MHYHTISIDEFVEVLSLICIPRAHARTDRPTNISIDRRSSR